jgi:hypothetical protein
MASNAETASNDKIVKSVENAAKEGVLQSEKALS